MVEGKLLFIYGTLRRGGRAHDLMSGTSYLGTGSVEGRLVDVGEYPGLIVHEGERVRGEVFLVGESQFVELDRYEGCFEAPPHYKRVSVDVLLESGETKEAEVYLFLRQLDDHELIKSGDWMDRVRGE